MNIRQVTAIAYVLAGATLYAIWHENEPHPVEQHNSTEPTFARQTMAAVATGVMR